MFSSDCTKPKTERAYLTFWKTGVNVRSDRDNPRTNTKVEGETLGTTRQN